MFSFWPQFLALLSSAFITEWVIHLHGSKSYGILSLNYVLRQCIYTRPPQPYTLPFTVPVVFSEAARKDYASERK
jgi:hypothetical protein